MNVRLLGMKRAAVVDSPTARGCSTVGVLVASSALLSGDGWGTAVSVLMRGCLPGQLDVNAFSLVTLACRSKRDCCAYPNEWTRAIRPTTNRALESRRHPPLAMIAPPLPSHECKLGGI